jgi:membrane-associated phospholipid phosphatase
MAFKGRWVALIVAYAGARPGLSVAQIVHNPVRVDSIALISRRSLWTSGSLGISALGLLPFDTRIAEEFRDPGPQQSLGLRRSARVFNTLGGAGVLAFGVGAYAAGRLTGHPTLAMIGAHTTEAIALSSVASGLIKGVVGRQRPFLDETSSHHFSLGGGFTHGEMTSFPSGHATAAFAAASVIANDLGHASRFTRWIVNPLLYGSASMVAFARMYDDKHWASDVVAGAAIGTFTGTMVSRFARRRRLERKGLHRIN